jgi:dihydropteroate synthase
MGVLNVTPDSFSDGGQFLDPRRAVARGREMVEQGAAIIDVGGESTRPGATPVPAAEEAERVVTVVAALAPHVRVSIDTTKAEVARAAVEAGATLINDVSASLWPVAADTGVGWVAMHRQGDPATMQDAPHYDDVVGEVLDMLEDRAARADAAGVDEVWIDPGLGFGKTAEHNLTLLAHLDRFTATGRPVLVGISRKATVGSLLAESDGTASVPVDDRLEGSLALATWAMVQGAAMVRAHDVLPTAQAAAVVGASSPARSPARRAQEEDTSSW